MVRDEINKRVIQAITWLLKNNPALNKTLIAEAFHVKPQKFSEILNKRMMAGMDIIHGLCTVYGMSPDWLLTGKGTMLKNSDNNTTSDNVANSKELIQTLKSQSMTIEAQANTILSLQKELSELRRGNEKKGTMGKGANIAGLQQDTIE